MPKTKKVFKPSSFSSYITSKNNVLKNQNNNDYIFLITFICCEKIMKDILRWYEFYNNDIYLEKNNVKLDGRKINPAINLYVGSKTDLNTITADIFYRKNNSAKSIRNKISHDIPKNSDLFSSKNFKSDMLKMEQFINYFS